jgi:hypothetical protein
LIRKSNRVNHGGHKDHKVAVPNCELSMSLTGVGARPGHATFGRRISRRWADCADAGLTDIRILRASQEVASSRCRSAVSVLAPCHATVGPGTCGGGGIVRRRLSVCPLRPRLSASQESRGLSVSLRRFGARPGHATFWTRNFADEADSADAGLARVRIVSACRGAEVLGALRVLGVSVFCSRRRNLRDSVLPRCPEP